MLIGKQWRITSVNKNFYSIKKNQQEISRPVAQRCHEDKRLRYSFSLLALKTSIPIIHMDDQVRNKEIGDKNSSQQQKLAAAVASEIPFFPRDLPRNRGYGFEKKKEGGAIHHNRAIHQRNSAKHSVRRIPIGQPSIQWRLFLAFVHQMACMHNSAKDNAT
ncbi:hypothetical protein CDAR_281871 [Caerostris darwini]|uniref:Uncharacterized protein n=1 Tax=Caerostris darwini TaxID=1538125 RepID=A0AAV4WR79_9ARAC|nr:hypothetical protein CDAR_281871 [Caerostris darwini]